MLNREDSNKILKGVKVIVFATTLSMLNPINANANKNIVEIEDNSVNNDYGISIGLITSSCLLIGIYNITTSKKRKDKKENYKTVEERKKELRKKYTK